MAASGKKLRAELEVDAEKAKRQLKELEDGKPGQMSRAASAPRSADRLSESLDRASKSVAAFGERSRASSSQIAGVVRSFAGLGAGMAVAYAARNMERGRARTAVEAAGGAISGASIASAALMAIPGGALAKALLTAGGAALGAGKVLFDKRGEQSAFAADFERGEREYAASRDWAAKLRELTGAGKADMGAEELEATAGRVAEAIARLDEEERARLVTINEEIRAGRLDAAQRERDDLATVRGKRAQLEAVRDGYARLLERRHEERPERRAAFRASTAGTDALARVGGSAYGAVAAAASGEAATAGSASPSRARGFGFSVPASRIAELSYGGPSAATDTDRAIRAAAERSAALDKEISDTLKAIERNTKGGDTWR